MIAFQNVSKSYSLGVETLDDVTFKIDPYYFKFSISAISNGAKARGL